MIRNNFNAAAVDNINFNGLRLSENYFRCHKTRQYKFGCKVLCSLILRGFRIGSVNLSGIASGGLKQVKYRVRAVEASFYAFY